MIKTRVNVWERYKKLQKQLKKTTIQNYNAEGKYTVKGTRERYSKQETLQANCNCLIIQRAVSLISLISNYLQTDLPHMNSSKKPCRK